MAERKHKRKNTLVLLDVLDPKNSDKSGRAAVIDISTGGAAFESAIRFEKGEPVELRFTIARGKVFVVDAVVRRVKERTGAHVYGVEFQDLGFFDKLKVKKLIATVAKK
ncbi:MAG: PilZ domain-containing protein [Elusimicrobiota bacterium]|nr:PilZ domain-containing protein [Elusimicrobiota bacterium]